MERKIFINLPVKGLDASKAFYQALGFTINKQFTNELAASIVISEHIYVMLLTEAFFKTFTTKEIADTTSTTEVINCLSAYSRDAVDELVNSALLAGGTATKLAQDHGFMYSRAFRDPDGHIWEVMWMDPAAVEPAQQPEVAEAATTAAVEEISLG
jgi:hypothetical protein